MTVIFQSNRGRVVRMNDPAAQARIGYVSVPNAPISYTTELAIITRVTISHQVNVQFLHTLGAHLYVYVFGDRIGQLSLSGLALNAACSDDTALGLGSAELADIIDQPLGIENMLRWYKDHRLSETGRPVRVLIGKTAIEGFVLSANEESLDPESGLVQWTVAMATLPESIPRPLIIQGPPRPPRPEEEEEDIPTLPMPTEEPTSPGLEQQPGLPQIPGLGQRPGLGQPRPPGLGQQPGPPRPPRPPLLDPVMIVRPPQDPLSGGGQFLLPRPQDPLSGGGQFVRPRQP